MNVISVIQMVPQPRPTPPRRRFIPGLASLPFLGLKGTEAGSPGSFSFPFRRMGLREGGFVRDGKAAYQQKRESVKDAERTRKLKVTYVVSLFLSTMYAIVFFL